MKLKNNFSEESRDLFFWNRFCWWCSRQHADCLHHILGRSSDSSLNAAPLSNFYCHIGNGELSNFEIKKMLLQKTFVYLMKNNYQLTTKDIEFKQLNKHYYD